MEGDIDITGIDKAELLAALYNGTRALGLGMIHDRRAGMTADDASFYLRTDGEPDRFDYVAGRPIKVEFNGDTLRFSQLYDRDAGPGACQRIVDALRAAK